MPIRIGANPIGWSNDDLQDIGGATPLETCLAEAREAGFVGMELGHKFPREPGALKAALDPFGMACISGWYSAELLKRDADEEMKHLRAHLDLLKAMGSTVLVFAETSNAIHGDRSKPLSQRPVMAAGDWAEFGRRITQVAERTLAEGVRLVYHHHMGTIVESETDIDAFMAATGEAAQLLLGLHDFTTFRSAHCQSQSPVKTLDRLTVSRHGDELIIEAAARSFLHHQVRSMVGCLALVGYGKWSARDLKAALEAADRNALGLNAPPDGLYFVSATYP